MLSFDRLRATHPTIPTRLEELPAHIRAPEKGNCFVFSTVRSPHTRTTKADFDMANSTNKPGILSKAMSIPGKVIRFLTLDPVGTGALIFILSRNPWNLRDRFSAQTGLSSHTLTSLISPFKWLFGIGLFRKAHSVMNRLAFNNWQLGSSGTPWRFGDEKKSEVVLITGGSSGFGRLMATEFAKHAKVIVLDLQDLPTDLAEGQSSCNVLQASLIFNSALNHLLQMRSSGSSCH